jgi:hypothetical protein
MQRNNDHGIFSNAFDDLAGLREVLDSHCTDADIEIVGCVAVFSARVP